MPAAAAALPAGAAEAIDAGALGAKLGETAGAAEVAGGAEEGFDSPLSQAERTRTRGKAARTRMVGAAYRNLSAVEH